MIVLQRPQRMLQLSSEFTFIAHGSQQWSIIFYDHSVLFVILLMSRNAFVTHITYFFIDRQFMLRSQSVTLFLPRKMSTPTKFQKGCFRIIHEWAEEQCHSVQTNQGTLANTFALTSFLTYSRARIDTSALSFLTYTRARIDAKPLQSPHFGGPHSILRSCFESSCLVQPLNGVFRDGEHQNGWRRGWPATNKVFLFSDCYRVAGLFTSRLKWRKNVTYQHKHLRWKMQLHDNQSFWISCG